VPVSSTSGKRGTSRGGKRPPVARWHALVACLGYWGVALAIVSRFPQVDAWGIRITLLSVRAVLMALGRHVERTGDTLSVGTTSIQIGADCSPHLPYLIFAGGVLAMRATWKARAIGLVLGAVAIHVFNVTRILTLMGVLAVRPEWFDFVHVYLWQIGTIVAVVAAFAAWLAWTGRPARAA
jgi:exosortase/archaeosortase family protein